MSSTYGENLKLTIFGQSHSPAIGVTIEGIPAGEKVDLDELQRFLNRRAPGKNAWSTPRKEADAPEILSGLVNGRTCGAPLTAIIRNTNTRPQDYENLALTPRPGHADYTAEVKYGGYQDPRGRRALFRKTHRAAVHCGRHLLAAPCARGHCSREPHRLHRGRLR